MKLTQRIICLLIVGFVFNALVAGLLSSFVNFSVAPRTRGPSPNIQFDPPYMLSTQTQVFRALGTQRRGWHFRAFSVDSIPIGGLFGQVFDGTTLPRIYFPTREGPFLSWTIGPESSWGTLYTTEFQFESDLDKFSGVEGASGFPALSFWHSLKQLDDGTYVTPGAVLLSEPSRLEIPEIQIRAIPYRPIWPGLIFNTVFYALFAFITHRLFRTIREHRRFTKGHCPKCKYDLNADFAPGCPECGSRRNTKPTPA